MNESSAKSTGTRTSKIRRCSFPLSRTKPVSVIRKRKPIRPPESPESKRMRIAGDNLYRNLAFRDLEVLRMANAGILAHKDIQSVVTKYQSRNHDVDRSHLDYRRILVKQGRPLPGEVAVKPPTPPKDDAPTTSITVGNQTNISPLTASTNMSPISDPSSSADKENQNNEIVKVRNKGGRNKGSTNAAKKAHELTVSIALTEASTLCLEEKNNAILLEMRVPNGRSLEIVNEVKRKYDLNEESFSYETVRSRVKNNNPTGIGKQIQSPLAPIEPEIVDWCIRLSEMGEALTKYELMELTDDIIRGTKYETDFLEYRTKVGIENNSEENSTAIVGEAWFQNFMTRWSMELKKGKCKIQDTQRHTWCITENFENMYDCVYKSMVACKVAVELDHEVMFNKDGEEVDDVALMYGRPTRFKLTKPERCVYVDETGCNTNMTKDKQIGGRNYISSRGQVEGQRTGVKSDLHFTVMAFTSGTGEVIMCSVIMKSENNQKDIPPSWRWGIDMTKNVESGRTEVETWDLNRENDVCKGGPVCYFEGHELPTFVCSSPNASITSELLVLMLQEMDRRNIFERSEELGTPFLLVDGHHSRTRLPFLKYVNNPLTAWRACIGVPYGTHIWQPADSTELNGTFKIALYREKQNYLRQKPPSQKKIVSSDVIPILNRCWVNTLANKRFARKAIAERGWNPLNYVLLDDKRLMRAAKPKTTTTDGGQPVSYLATTFRHKNGLVYTSRLSSLIEAENKCAGRKRRNEEVRARLKENDGNLDKLTKAIGRPRSGNMAANGLYDLNEHVRDVLQDDEDKKDELAKGIELRKAEATTKQDKKFQNAAKKYFRPDAKDLLSVDDLKVILRQIWKKGDLPMKSRKHELEQQLFERKDRMEEYRSRYTVNVVAVDSNIQNESVNIENCDLFVAQMLLDNVDAVDALVSLNLVEPLNGSSTISAASNSSAARTPVSEEVSSDALDCMFTDIFGEEHSM